MTSASSLPEGWSLGAGLEGEGMIVTGAGRGIGQAVAHAVASTGARVMAVDMNGEALEETIAGMPGEGHVAVVQDLADISAHAALVRRAQRRARRPLGHRAHGRRAAAPRLVTEVTEEDWDVQIDVNLKAAFFLCREVGLALQEIGRRRPHRHLLARRAGGRAASAAPSSTPPSKGGVTLVHPRPRPHLRRRQHHGQLRVARRRRDPDAADRPHRRGRREHGEGHPARPHRHSRTSSRAPWSSCSRSTHPSCPAPR